MIEELREAYEQARRDFMVASCRNRPQWIVDKRQKRYMELSDAYHGIGACDEETIRRLKE